MSNRPAPPLVSIVTPLYNCEEYLEECIRSVLAQTYPHWNYTIVNNCSTDRSLEIARRYSQQDARIRIQENQTFLPVVANHNAAVRQISADAKYCKVVFADDWIFPECLEKMVAMAERHPTAGMVSAYCLEGEDVSCTGLPYTTELLDGLELGRRTFLDRLHLFGSANCLLYRADLIRSRVPFYNESNIHADTEACFSLLKVADFAFVHQVLTFTRRRPESLTAISDDLYTHLSGMLLLLSEYGPHFLSRDEQRRLLSEHLDEYYRFLSKSLVFRRDQKALHYHREQLAKAGFPFSHMRFVQALFANVGKSLSKPHETFGKFLNARRRGPTKGF